MDKRGQIYFSLLFFYSFTLLTLKKVEMELADVLIYLIRIADKLGIDLIDAANKKIEINEDKYPADKV
jgi:NTP pyrophosphatase (non-canonical NTP hydrolase)